MSLTLPWETRSRPGRAAASLTSAEANSSPRAVREALAEGGTSRGVVEPADELACVPDERARVEDGVEVELGCGFGQQVAQVHALAVGALGRLLHHAIGVVARAAGLHQRQQCPLRVERAVGELEVGPHALLMDHHAVHHADGEVLGVVEQRRCVGQRHPLDRRVRDVALVPERHVLEAGLRVAAQEPRDTGDPLAYDRVPLVRHRGRALLGARPERLLQLAHLGALQMADLGGEALEAGPCKRDRAQQLGVPVARHDLGRDVLLRQAKPPQHGGLDLRPVCRVGAHGAREGANRHPLHGVLQPAQVPVGLEREPGELEAECRGLGVDAVRASHAERVHVLTGAAHQRVAVVARSGHDHEAGLGELQRQGRVEHVRGGEAVVHPASRLADGLGHHVHEGRHVVIGDLLALADRLGAERGALANRVRVLPRHHARLCKRVHHRQLHLEPGLELPLLGPHRPHLGTRVAVDHRSRLRRPGSSPPARPRCARCPRPRRPQAPPAASARSPAGRRDRPRRRSWT